MGALAGSETFFVWTRENALICDVRHVYYGARGPKPMAKPKKKGTENEKEVTCVKKSERARGLGDGAMRC